MPAPLDPLSLAADFPPASADQWHQLMTAVLRKSGLADAEHGPEAALTTTTYGGIAIKPMYTAADLASLPSTGGPGQAPFVRGRKVSSASVEPGVAGWDVRTRYTGTDAKAVNAAALAELNTGATSIWLTVGDPAGIPVAELGTALRDVYLDLAPIVLEAGAETSAAATTLLTVTCERGIDRSRLRGSLGADPIGLRARTGAAANLAELGELAALVGEAPGLHAVTVDATVYHDAGGSDVDELAVSIAVGVAYLRALTASAGATAAGSSAGGGLSVDEALATIDFRYAVTADQFLSIAKLRAARQLWDRVAELSGASAERGAQVQHAVTSAAMLTRRDPWVNLLRTTVACFAAAIGGADAITVAPFDSAIGESDDFARRIARNTHAVLHDESNIARVVDAAGGSWYVESLTCDLATAAWDRFTAIEKAGGALAALDSGLIGELLAVSRDARSKDIAHRRAPITGVSEYAFIGEAPVSRPAAPVSRPAAPVSRPAAPAAGGPGLLPVIRYAQDFEALRDRSDAAADRPKVFLAALGPFAAYARRVGFAKNLFQAGGIESVVGTSGDTPSNRGVAAGEDPGRAELVSAFRASGSTVACLCSSDKVYAAAAAAHVAALKAAGAKHIWLAGQPGSNADAYRSAGIDGYIFAGCDALDVLRSTLDLLGVSE